MIDISSLRLNNKSYRNIFIVGNRNDWKSCYSFCNKETDLILCVDFGLKIDLSLNGYEVQFIDHLIKEQTLNKLNAEMHYFLYNWHNDVEGNDIFKLDGVPLGNSFLLYLINDVTYFCHFFFNIYALKTLEYENLYLATREKSIFDICDLLKLEHISVTIDSADRETEYLFPIDKWMKEATGKGSFMKKIKQIFISGLKLRWVFKDLLLRSKKTIYFQVYHPTLPVVKELKSDYNLRIILDNFTLKDKTFPILKQRVVQFKKKKVSKELTQVILRKYREGIKMSWEFEGYDMCQFLSKYLDKVVDEHIEEAISITSQVTKFFDKNGLDLMIPVTDLWMDNRLIMNYCYSRSIPVFFIMNGLLNNSFSREGKDSKYVNCYSVTCKDDFFEGADNVFPLGDPRMDKYSNIYPKQIDRVSPTIIIGAAGYDVTDINSYLAYEFDFLYDILKSIDLLRGMGYKNKVVLKVRANGYVQQYQNFVNEYFSNLSVEIYQSAPFYEVIKNADLYISIFSQTQFEAACLGIPTIYYKKDTQTFFRPFDSKSELLTANSTEELIKIIEKFYNNEPDFDLFMQKAILESYIGPLDGKNLDRNIEFINQILNDN